MNREDVIKLAREAGCKPFRSPEHWDDVQVFATPDVLERFAALVSAAEREKLAAWMIKRGYATGHGDTIGDLLNELDEQIFRNWRNAMKIGVETERQACAKVCEGLFQQTPPYTTYAEAAQDCADAIRARGQA